jgi:hypothetical protein
MKELRTPYSQRSLNMNRIEKPYTDLDWNSVYFGNGNWSWGNGGYPLDDNEFFIAHTDDKFVETRYKMPICINEMLKVQRRHGNDEKLRMIQSALGI